MSKYKFYDQIVDMDNSSSLLTEEFNMWYLILQKVPIFISWIRYMSFNYHTYKLLLKVQYEHLTPIVNGVKIDSGLTEVAALISMVFGYRFLAYLSLRRMKLQ